MLIIETLLAAFFVVTNVITEAANLKTMNPVHHFISDYLAHVKLSWLQDLGFLALALDMILVGTHFGHQGFMDTALYLASFAMVLMIPTKTLQKIDTTDSKTLKKNAFLEMLHKIATATAFTLANYAIIRFAFQNNLTFALYTAIGGPLLILIYYHFWRDKFPGVEEKAYTAFLLSSIFSILSFMSGVI